MNFNERKNFNTSSGKSNIANVSTNNNNKNNDDAINTGTFNENQKNENEAVDENERIQNIYSQLKLKYYQNLLKFEQQYNSGLTSLINNLQDNEMKEIVSNVDSYLNSCLSSIKENDSLFNVTATTINSNKKINNNSNNMLIKGIKRKIDLPPIVDPKTNFISTSFNKNITHSNNHNIISNDVINITSIVPFDLTRYGLKSGPIQQLQLNVSIKPTKNSNKIDKKKVIINEKTDEKANNSINNLSNFTSSSRTSLPSLDLNKSLNSMSSNINEMSSFNKGTRSNKASQQIQSRNVIVFKYLLVLELNQSYFLVEKTINDNSLLKIKMLRKPFNWSFNEYESLTVVLDSKKTSNSNENLFLSNSALSIGSSGLNASSWNKSYFNKTEAKKLRFLNSKALLDRLYKHFQENLIDWPKHESNSEHQQQQSTNAHNKYAFSNDNLAKTCQQVNNQIKITMKWKGIKLKDVDVIVLVNIGIKYNDLILENNFSNSTKLIIGNFLRSGGCSFYSNFNINSNNEVLIDKLMQYAETVCKLDLKTMYLSADTGVHFWSTNLLILRLNLLKFLCHLSSLTTSTLNNSLSNIFNMQTNNASSSNATNTYKLQQHQQNSLLLNNNSNLFVLIKIIQIIKYLGFNSVGIYDKFDNDLQNEEDLIANLAFNEINKCILYENNSMVTNSYNSYNTIYDNNSTRWFNENLFDRLWSVLIDLRNSILNIKMKDQLNIYDNILPKSWINYIGIYTLGLLIPPIATINKNLLYSSNSLDTNYKNASNVNNSSNNKTLTNLNNNNYNNNNKKDEILEAIEVGIKLFLTTICIDESEFNIFNYNREINKDPDITSPFNYSTELNQSSLNNNNNNNINNNNNNNNNKNYDSQNNGKNKFIPTESNFNKKYTDSEAAMVGTTLTTTNSSLFDSLSIK